MKKLDLTKLKFEDLINRVKKKNKEISNLAYEEIERRLEKKINLIVNKFSIPGYDASDIRSEACFALRFKAIKDYDPDKSKTDGAFESFAVICMRRHLSTQLKVSFQNKKIILNQSVSMSSSKDDNKDLSEILSNDGVSTSKSVEDKEFYLKIIKELNGQLSSFEKQVLFLYKKKMSYEEIAEVLNKNKNKKQVGIKSIDNALSRIKMKAKKIYNNLNLD